MIYNLKLFLLLILYQFIDDLVAWEGSHLPLRFALVDVAVLFQLNIKVYDDGRPGFFCINS